jgi:hypothetical protein
LAATVAIVWHHGQERLALSTQTIEASRTSSMENSLAVRRPPKKDYSQSNNVAIEVRRMYWNEYRVLFTPLYTCAAHILIDSDFTFCFVHL